MLLGTVVTNSQHFPVSLNFHSKNDLMGNFKLKGEKVRQKPYVEVSDMTDKGK